MPFKRVGNTFVLMKITLLKPIVKPITHSSVPRRKIIKVPFLKWHARWGDLSDAILKRTANSVHGMEFAENEKELAKINTSKDCYVCVKGNMTRQGSIAQPVIHLEPVKVLQHIILAFPGS